MRYDVEPRINVKGWAIGILTTAIAVIVLFAIFGAAYTVDQSERGVIKRNGAVIGTAEPGWHTKIPFIDGVTVVSTRTLKQEYHDVSSYSRDQQEALLTLSINYSVPADRVDDVVIEYGSLESMVATIVDPRVLKELKNVFGKFNAVTSIQERTRLNSETLSAIQAAVEAVGAPVVIESVQIENVKFGDVYDRSIQERMVAEVAVQRAQQNLAQEKIAAEIAVTQAQGRADSVVAEATAQAEAIKLRGQAEAEAIRARGSALRDNPLLIQLTQAERWNGTLPTTMVPDGTVPFLDVGPDPTR